MATQTVQVVTGVKANFRAGSARALYWQVVAAHNGKSVNVLTKALTASPPSVPARGKLKGKQEPVTGWLSWFVRNGYITIS